MGLGLEKEDGSLITPKCRSNTLSMPLDAGRRISTETCGLGDVFPLDDLGAGLYTELIIIYMPCIIAAFWVIEISSF